MDLVFYLIGREEEYFLTIVVKKVPKPFRGLVKFVFGIKDT